MQECVEKGIGTRRTLCHFYNCYMGAKKLFSSSVNDQIGGLSDTLFLHPTSPYWYLYALFFIFLVTPTFSSARAAAVGIIISLFLRKVIISPERKKQLNQNLMMFFTGFTRFSSDVQKANAAGKQDKTAQLKEMLALVDDAERVLTDKNADLDDFGRMLDHTWKLKRQTGSAVSTNSIDELYAKGVAAGALGGKLLGAGGGGFLVFYVQPERQDAVRWAMRDLMHIPFAFEDGGTRVIHYTPETYEPKN